MRIEVFESLDEAKTLAWNTFLAKSSHEHPRQSLRFAVVERAIGHDVRFVIGSDEAGVRAVALVSFRGPVMGGFTDAAVLSGPVCDDIAALEAFLRGLAGLPAFRKVGRLQVSPYWLEDEARKLQPVLGRLGWKSAENEDFRHTGLIDLRKSDEVLLEGFGKSARRKVRLAQKNGFTVRPLTSREDCAAVYGSLNTMRARHSLSPIGETEGRAQFEHIFADPQLGIALGAFHGEVFLGGLLIYRSRHTAHARHFSSEQETLRKFNNLRIAPLLWWVGMGWARDQGCAWLDLEGYKADVGQGDPHYNVFEYKGEFHPTPVIRVSEHYIVTNFVRHAPRHLRALLARNVKAAIRGARAMMQPKTPAVAQQRDAADD